MKKILLLLTTAFLLCSAGWTSMYAQTPIASTDLTLYLWSANTNYKLTGDCTATGGITLPLGVSIDGDNYTITMSGGCQTLFLSLSGDTIENINLKTTINGTWGSGTPSAQGPLCGDATNVTFRNCRIDPSSTAIMQSQHAGGLVGYANNCTFIECRSNIQVACNTVWFPSGRVGGGLVAIASSSSFTRCFATGSVSGGDAGGLVGNMTGGSITDCYALGSVYASGTSGSSYCDNGGSVAAFSSFASSVGAAGGLVGRAASTPAITTSYAAGAVSAIADNTTGSVTGTCNFGFNNTISYYYGAYSGAIIGYGAVNPTSMYYALAAISVTGSHTNTTATGLNQGKTAGYSGFSFGSVWAIYPTSTYPMLVSTLVDRSYEHQITHMGLSSVANLGGSSFYNACTRNQYSFSFPTFRIFGALDYFNYGGGAVTYHYRLHADGTTARFNDVSGRAGVSQGDILPTSGENAITAVQTVIPATDFNTYDGKLHVAVYPKYSAARFDNFTSIARYYDNLVAEIRPLPQVKWEGYIDAWPSRFANLTTPLNRNTICYDYRDTTMTAGYFSGQNWPTIEPGKVDSAYARITFTGTAPYEFSFEKKEEDNGTGFKGDNLFTGNGTPRADGVYTTKYPSMSSLNPAYHSQTAPTAGFDGMMKWAASSLTVPGGSVGLFSLLPNHVDVKGGNGSETVPRAGAQPAYTGFNLQFTDTTTAVAATSNTLIPATAIKTGYYVQDYWGCISNSHYAYYKEAFTPYKDPATATNTYDTVMVNPLPIVQYPYPEYQDVNRSFAHMDTVICEGDTVWKKVFYNPVIDPAFADSMHFLWTWTTNPQTPLWNQNAFILPLNNAQPFNANASIYMPAANPGDTYKLTYNSWGTVAETDSLNNYWSFPSYVQWQPTQEYVLSHIKDPRTYANLFPSWYAANPSANAGITTFNVDMPDLRGIELNDYASFAVVGPMDAARCNQGLDSVPTFKVPIEWRGSVTKANIRITPFFVNIKGGVCYAKKTDYGYNDHLNWRYRGVTDYSITVNPRPFPLIENQYQLSVANGSSSKPIYLDNQIVDFDTVPSPRHRLLPLMNYQPAIDTSWYAWTNVSPQMGLVTVYDSVSGSAVPPVDPSYPIGGSLYSAFPRARDYIPAFEVYNYSLHAVYDTIRIRPYFINRIVCHGRDTIAVIKILPKQKPAILESPQSAIICQGTNHVLSVTATGDNLSFEWFKGGVKMNGRYDDTLQINNASFYDYDDYYVKVTGLNDSIVISDPAHIWVADPLPNDLKFTTELTTVEPNKSYPLTVAYYDLDVPVYTWTYSNNSAAFAYLETSTHDNLFKTGANPQSGTISVEMTHVCGNRTLTQDIIATGGTGIDEVGGEFRIYPNPVSSILYIQPKNGERNEASDAVVVTDANGRVIKSTLLAPINYQLSTSGWTSGVYFVQVKTNAGTEVHKIVKN